MTKRTKKLIDSLEKSIKDKDREIQLLKDDISDKNNFIDELDKKLAACNHAISSTPSDCKRGPWCEACGFRKEIRVNRGFVISDIVVCGKGDSCVNFIQQEM
jgi:hypothetical protein